MHFLRARLVLRHDPSELDRVLGGKFQHRAASALDVFLASWYPLRAMLGEHVDRPGPGRRCLGTSWPAQPGGHAHSRLDLFSHPRNLT
jgi:hypothetical protein